MGSNGLDDRVVVVIVGATSGIGRAAARLFAERGASVVLAGRREQLLQEVAQELTEAGGRALAVSADVREQDQMDRLAERAISAFGGIDVWVNNAGVASFGKFEDTPPEVFGAVVETTFFGVVNGFRAVLPHFRQRGHGIVITTASVAGRMAAPYHAAYGAAKHAVLGFAESVREELRLDGVQGIHVCSVLPGPVDTPFWQHAANYTGRRLQAVSSPVAPEKVARAIVDCALHPRREVGVGAPSWAVELGMAVAQGPMERLMGKQISGSLMTDRPQGRTDGSLFRPMSEGEGESGGWREPGHSTAGMALTGALALAIPLGIAALMRARSRSGGGGSQDGGDDVRLGRTEANGVDRRERERRRVEAARARARAAHIPPSPLEEPYDTWR